MPRDARLPARTSRRAQADGRTDLDTRVQAVIFAAVHGDASACVRYGVTKRTLRNYRAAVRERDSETARTFRAYAEALGAPDGAPSEARVETFAAFMEARVRELVELFAGKAAELNPDNPEALRALGDMVGRLLEHLVAVEYIGRLFGVEAPRPEAPHKSAPRRSGPPLIRGADRAQGEGVAHP